MKNKRIYKDEIIFGISDEDTDKVFFEIKKLIEKNLNIDIPVKMGGVMDEFSSSFKIENIDFKLNYCNWLGTELKVSTHISPTEKEFVEKLVLKLLSLYSSDSPPTSPSL